MSDHSTDILYLQNHNWFVNLPMSRSLAIGSKDPGSSAQEARCTTNKSCPVSKETSEEETSQQACVVGDSEGCIREVFFTMGPGVCPGAAGADIGLGESNSVGSSTMAILGAVDLGLIGADPQPSVPQAHASRSSADAGNAATNAGGIQIQALSKLHAQKVGWLTVLAYVVSMNCCYNQTLISLSTESVRLTKG